MATMADKWFQNGVEKGIGIGIEKVAKIMLSKGKSFNEIHELTGLPLEQIESIRKNGQTSTGDNNVSG